MGITRDSRHKRRETGGRRHPHQKKRKFETGRPAANTKLGPKRIHLVRARGGNLKYRALRLDTGNFSWGSEAIAKKARVLDVVYNASNNELVRTKTLVKNAIVAIDCTPFRTWFETHYHVKVGEKGAEAAVVPEAAPATKQSRHLKLKVAGLQKAVAVDPKVVEQFQAGRVLAAVSSRPGQSGRVDGYILEGAELEFYQRKLALKKTGKAGAKA